MKSNGTSACAIHGAPQSPFHACLFGTFRLAGPDGIDMTPVGRKARALVAYLLTIEGHAAPRERLAALLWSRHGEDQARASLRQALYALRPLRDGGSALLLVDRLQVRLDPARAVTDLDDCGAWTTVGRGLAPPGAPGDRFLDDLDGIDPAFDEWLSDERVRRADARRRAVLRAARQALVADDAETAWALADALLAADRTDESAACIAMDASHRLQNREQVRRIYSRLQAALRDELGIAVAAATTATHRRCLADVACALPMAALRPDPVADPAAPARVARPASNRRRGRASLLAATTGALALVGILTTTALQGAADTPGQTGRQSGRCPAAPLHRATDEIPMPPSIGKVQGDGSGTCPASMP